jgi:hypothetical protein
LAETRKNPTPGARDQSPAAAIPDALPTWLVAAKLATARKVIQYLKAKVRLHGNSATITFRELEGIAPSHVRFVSETGGDLIRWCYLLSVDVGRKAGEFRIDPRILDFNVEAAVGKRPSGRQRKHDEVVTFVNDYLKKHPSQGPSKAIKALHQQKPHLKDVTVKQYRDANRYRLMKRDERAKRSGRGARRKTGLMRAK